MEIFWNFFEIYLEFFERIFWEEFFGRKFWEGIFWEDFFVRNFVGEIFWEDFLGRIFLGGIFGRNSLFTLLRSAKLFEYGI